jgi:hypothetical protein
MNSKAHRNANKRKSFLLGTSLVLVLLLAQTCATGIASRKIIFRNSNSSFYSLYRDALPSRDRQFLPESFSHPSSEVTADEWKGILGNLKFRKESSVGNMIYPIFALDELDDLVRNLIPALSKIESDQMLVIISKFNDTKSVVSRDRRTSLLIFIHEQTVNLIFGEIQDDMGNIETGNFYEWSVIPEIGVKNNYRPLRVYPSEIFQYGKVDGFDNQLWLIFSLKDRNRFELEPRAKDEPEVEVLDEMEKIRMKAEREKNEVPTGIQPKSNGSSTNPKSESQKSQESRLNPQKESRSVKKESERTIKGEDRKGLEELDSPPADPDKIVPRKTDSGS